MTFTDERLWFPLLGFERVTEVEMFNPEFLK